MGDRTVINDNALIAGRYIEIGREAWIDENAHIGGINSARKVIIGD